jgi:transglutaminase-like putative cysteine protease
VSGYVHPREEKLREDKVRERSSADGATHAWVEALLPGLGWVGLDPTSNLLAGERHIRTAIGRDYADVPPTKGIFKGDAASELAVSVRVAPSDAPPPPDADLRAPVDWVAAASAPVYPPLDEVIAQQQQQQQSSGR